MTNLASKRTYLQIFKGVIEGDVDQVKRTLEADEQGPRELSAMHCFWALMDTIRNNQEEGSSLILDYAHKVYDEETIIGEIKDKGLVAIAVRTKRRLMLPVIERLVDKAVPVGLRLVREAFDQGPPEIAELIGAHYQKISGHIIKQVQAGITSKEIRRLVERAMYEGDVDLVQKILKTDEQGSRNLSAGDCFPIWSRATIRGWKDGGLLLMPILDYAEKVYEKEIILGQIEKEQILHHLFSNKIKYPSVLKRLIEMEVPVEDSLLKMAFPSLFAEVAEVLISAGCSLHWTFDDVMLSDLMESAMVRGDGKRVLQLLDDLGMDFEACISSAAALMCMHMALSHGDSSAVLFLLCHGFDANACIDSKPLLNYLLDVRFYVEQNEDGVEENIGGMTTLRSGWDFSKNDVISECLKQGANPLLRDKYANKSAFDICIENIPIENSWEHLSCLGSWYGNILKIFFKIGFRYPESKLHSIPPDVVIGNSCAPSLQALCRSQIRLEKGSKITEFVDSLPYSQKYKDRVMLRDSDFDPLNLTLKALAINLGLEAHELLQSDHEFDDLWE